MKRKALNPTPERVPFVALWRAEAGKLQSRLSVRWTLVICALLGLAGPLFLWLVGQPGVLSPEPLVPGLVRTAATATRWSLELRNFFIFRVLLVMIGALALAGEYQARTLREDLLRPVSRTQVLLAKWAALASFVLFATAVSWIISALSGLLLFPNEGSWLLPTLGYLATALTDVGFAALILCGAVLLRSVAGTLVGTFLFLVANYVINGLLHLIYEIGLVAQQSIPALVAGELIPWLPTSAYSAWRGLMGGDVDWQSFVALGLYTVIFLGIADRVFRRIDVP